MQVDWTLPVGSLGVIMYSTYGTARHVRWVIGCNMLSKSGTLNKGPEQKTYRKHLTPYHFIEPQPITIDSNSGSLLIQSFYSGLNTPSTLNNSGGPLTSPGLNRLKEGQPSSNYDIRLCSHMVLIYIK
jgi:hypothetical protein